MDLATSMTEQPWFRRLGKRSGTFYQMVKHLDSGPAGWIIETGTARIKDNWEGDGQSTLIWDWYVSSCPEMRAMSIDIDASNVKNAMSQTSHVTYHCEDSVLCLSSLPQSTLERTRLLYLDSFDWSTELNLESAFHHMAELASVWAFLPRGCMVVVDDRHGPLAGKHWLVEGFFSKLGIAPSFVEYHIGWIK